MHGQEDRSVPGTHKKKEKATQSKQTVATTGLKGIGPYSPSCPYTDLERSTNPIASFPPLTVLQLIHAGCTGRGKAEYFIILSGSLLPSYCGRYSELLFAIGHSKSSSCISFSQRQQFGRFVLFCFFLVENGCWLWNQKWNVWFNCCVPFRNESSPGWREGVWRCDRIVILLASFSCLTSGATIASATHQKRFHTKRASERAQVSEFPC